ncbi:hypothetical protein GCM10010295_62890 [Streptomyces intermedius]
MRGTARAHAGSAARQVRFYGAFLASRAMLGAFGPAGEMGKMISGERVEVRLAGGGRC